MIDNFGGVRNSSQLRCSPLAIPVRKGLDMLDIYHYPSSLTQLTPSASSLTLSTYSI